MPFVLNPSSGKYEFQGEVPEAAPNAGASPVAVAEEKKPPEKVESKKPWWQQAGDFVGDAVESANPMTRYIPNPVEGFNALRQGKVPPSIKRLQNDVQYEVNTLTKSPQSAIARMGGYAMDQTSVLPQDAKNTLYLGGSKMTANAMKAVLDPVGLGGPAAEATVDQALDEVYEAGGFKPPSQMNEEELGGDDMRASLVLNGLLALGTQGVSAKIQGSAFLATKFPWLAKTLGFADVTKANTLLGKATRFAFGQVLDELPSTFFDDNTGGSGQQLLGLGVGAFNPELGAEISKNDPAIQPGRSRTGASVQAFLPNLGASLALVGGLMGLAKGLPATQRAISSANTRMRRQSTRKALVDAEVIVEDEAGKTAFSPKVFETMGEVEEALNAAVAKEEGFAGNVPEGALPEAQSADIDPWAVEYDPQILEADTAAEVIEAQLDDVEIDELLVRSQSENTAEVLDEISSRNAGAPTPDGINYETSAAPVSSLATQGNIFDRFSSVPTATLRALADPQTSPDLANAIKQMTGKDPSTFDRIDVLEGIKALEADGRTVMPSRLMGQPTMLVEDIEVDPQRFQFKQGTDEAGQQKGNSLTGVDIWNEDMEGAIQVWTDPMDGLTYVVNGHNRLAKARQLGIPSMRVEYINAPSDEVARGKGAITNIAQGGGTSFDAAKFLRDSGITEPGQLEALGVPMRSGLATEGLALSKLPDNIFQDAVDGRVSKGKAMALGGSGLDETGMQQAYKALQSRDMTDSTFNEVLQQARSAPTVQGDQVDLFGNTDMLNLMVQKGELAARIRKDLMADKNLMARTAKNANRLTEVGNEIDKAGTKTLADDTQALLAEFDADKYMDGPTSELLNEGALQIENGAKVKVVADRIRRQLIETAENTPASEKAIDPEVMPAEPAGSRKGSITDGLTEALAASEALDRQMARRTGEFLDKQAKGLADLKETITRQEKITSVVKQAARKGDVRPPSTPLPESPAVPDVDVNQRADVVTLEILDNEARLMDEYQAIDDALAGDKLEAERLAIGYDEMTFDQKKGAGMLDGLAEDKPQALPEFVIPKDLSKSAPRFGRAKLQFESDLDRAAYMIRDKAKKSKGEDRMIAALEEQGYDIDEIRELGNEVKTQIQDGIQEVTGSRRAPQEEFTIQVPKSALASTSSPRLSNTGPQLSRSGEYDEGQFRKRLERVAAAKAAEEEAALLDIGFKLPTTIAGMTRVSEGLGRELVAGLKDAARVSGLDPLRIQYLDTVDTRKLFGDADANQALAQWRPDAARFARENPDDPLVAIADGGTAGVFVPRDYASIHRHMIYLALGPNLDKRLGSPGLVAGGGTPMRRTAYHESFHAVQDWLEMMSVKGGLGSKSVSMMEAMGTEEAIAEMTKLVKNDKFGNYVEGMDIKELQAEAFASWYNNRKVRLKAGGLQAAFEKIKKFINTLRRKWQIALDKDPSYVDVFELAAAGKIADKGNQAIAKLRPEQLEALKGRIDSNMDALLPDLTDRVQSYLKQKQADFDVLTDKLADETNMEGC